MTKDRALQIINGAVQVLDAETGEPTVDKALAELGELKAAIAERTLEQFCPGSGAPRAGIEVPADGNNILDTPRPG